MRFRGTDRKAVEEHVTGSPVVADYARLYPTAQRRIIDVITGLSADYEAQGFSILIETPDTPEARIDRIRKQFDLTRSEAALAAHIADGGDIGSFAEMRGVTRNTARNQLQKVFDQTGARRQSELVRLLADY